MIFFNIILMHSYFYNTKLGIMCMHHATFFFLILKDLESFEMYILLN